MNRWWPDGDSNADRLPLSALEHHAYCPRQAALIHIDGVFTDDVNTTLGHLAHQRVDQPHSRATPQPGARISTSVPVWSRQYGLYGIADAIETTATTAVPIEHKVGCYHPGGPADVQVAAQAICLREMLDMEVPYGDIYSHADRRRHRVEMTDDLLDRVLQTIHATRALLAGVDLPPAVNDRRCRGCSLRDDCLPSVVADGYHDNAFAPRPLGDWNA